MVAIQIGGDPSKLKPLNGTSEDCLYLNVMTPQASRSGQKPVMVYIHGGGGGRPTSTLLPSGITFRTDNIPVLQKYADFRGLSRLMHNLMMLQANKL
jgi:carboxylesterase type B